MLVTLRPNENFWTVAKSNGVNVDSILGANPFLKSIYAYPGQRILVPSAKGVLHPVRRGETLAWIAGLYGKEPGEVRKANRRRPRPGDVVFVPSAKPQVMTAQLARFYDLRRRFIRPIHGWIGAHYGVREVHPVHKTRKFHKGIDLGAPRGSAIFAAAAGTVTYAGWAEGYGLLVVIDHGDGFETWYGHCSQLFVKPGQGVRQGQVIARMGATGTAVVPHLHFEVRTNGVPINPMRVLW